MRAAVCTIEGKGGVGKSTTSAIAVEALRQDGRRSVAIVDGDTTNSSMVSMFDDVVPIDMAEAEAAGELAALFRSPADFLVADFGARSEARFLDPILPRILKSRTKSEPSIVVLRPLTLSSFVQNNTVSFIEKTAPLGVKFILVKNLSQGRTKEHFSDWDQSRGRRRALDLGAREVDLSDAGVRWGDEVPAFGLSFSAVARGDFSRAEEHLLPLVQQTFTAGVQAHLGFWVEENAEALLKAFQELGIKT